MSDWVRETVRRYLAETPRPRIIIEGAGRDPDDLRAEGYAAAIADVVAWLRAVGEVVSRGYGPDYTPEDLAHDIERGDARGAAKNTKEGT